MAEDDDDARMSDCHEMLLRLAGRLPDDLMTRCREQLAQGAFEEMARGVAFCVLSQNLPLASPDVAVLTALLAESGGDASALGDVEIDDSDPVRWYFTDDPPGAADTETDGEAREESAGREELDQAMADALDVEPDAIGCWRAWRVPPDGPPSGPGKAVFVVEVSADADVAGMTAHLQQQLAAAGEASPQVEVYPWHIELPVYQRLARGYGELVWAVEEDPGMQLASIFDEVDPQDGPRFSPDHPRLDEDEAGKVAQYLREAEPVLVTTAQLDDVVDTTRQYCVPLNFRTDGMWIWAEASAYYAQEHHLEPDPGLLAHIRSNNHTVPVVDGVALHRALALLQQPPEAEPVWTFGAESSQPFDGQDSADQDGGGQDSADQDGGGQDSGETAHAQDGIQATEGEDGSQDGSQAPTATTTAAPKG
jgi:hypothetical protein